MHFLILSETSNHNHVDILPSRHLSILIMSWWNHFLCTLHSYRLSFQEKVELIVQEVDFKAHQTTKCFNLVYCIGCHKFIVRFHVAQKLSYYFFKWYPSCLFFCTHRCFELRIEHTFSNTSPNENTFFHSSVKWNFLHKYLK